MPLHFHWFTSIALALAELLTFLALRQQHRLPVFRWYLLLVALRSLFPYARFADTPIVDGFILTLRTLTIAEFYFEIGWKTLEQKSWMLVGAGCFQLTAMLILMDFKIQPDAWHPNFVLVRQLIHVELFVAVLTALLWFWYYEVRHSEFSGRHGWLLLGYLANYCAVGFWIAMQPDSRCTALATFDITAMVLLGLWIVAARACSSPDLPNGAIAWPRRTQPHTHGVRPPS